MLFLSLRYGADLFSFAGGTPAPFLGVVAAGRAVEEAEGEGVDGEEGIVGLAAGVEGLPHTGDTAEAGATTETIVTPGTSSLHGCQTKAPNIQSQKRPSH